MSGSTIYRLLEPSDSAAAARLLVRNRFFFGSLDHELTAERFDLLQKLKGLLYGVCAEHDGEIIALLCAYSAGADRTANPHQVFVSALLVDEAHRTRLYSFIGMYRLLLQHLAKTMPEVRELLLEVYSGNLPSLYMQRMFGSLIVDGEMANPEEIFLRNFGPAIQRFYYPMMMTTKQRIESSLLPFDKKNVKEVTPLMEGRLVPITYITGGTPMTVYCNIYSGCVCRIRSEEEFFAGLENGGLFLENLSDKAQSWKICPFPNTPDDPEGENIAVSVQPGQRLFVFVPASLSDCVLSLEDTFCAFHLKMDEDWTDDAYNPEPAALSLAQPLALKQKTGLLTASSEGRVCFHEVFPYVTAPYLFGTVCPDPERKIVTTVSGPGKISAEQTRHGFCLKREYTITGEEAAVQTVVCSESGDRKEFDPVFALHLQDMKGSCEFHMKQGDVIEKTFDYVRDLDIAHDEVILYEFVSEDYAAREFDYILLHFEGAVWKITTDRPFRAYLHCNYIFLRPLPALSHKDGWTWKDDRADFGTILIRKV